MTNTLLSFLQPVLTHHHLHNAPDLLLSSFSQNHPFSHYHFWATSLASPSPIHHHPTTSAQKSNLSISLFIHLHLTCFHTTSFHFIFLLFLVFLGFLGFLGFHTSSCILPSTWSNGVHWNRQSHSSTFPFLDLVDLIDVIFIVSHSYLLHLKSNLFPFSFKVREWHARHYPFWRFFLSLFLPELLELLELRVASSVYPIAMPLQCLCNAFAIMNWWTTSWL